MAELVLIYDSVTGGFISKQAGSTHIANAAITSALVASGAIGGAHLAAAAIVSALIASGAIGSSHLGYSPGATTSGLTSSEHASVIHVSGQVGSGQIDNIHLRVKSFDRLNSLNSGNRFVTPGWFAYGGGPMSLSIARLYFLPIIVPSKYTYTGILCNVASALAGITGRMGVYAWSGGGPGALLLDAGTVSLATTGAKEIVISLTLDAGWYFLAFTADGVATMRTVDAATAAGVPLGGVTNTTVTQNEVLVPVNSLRSNDTLSGFVNPAPVAVGGAGLDGMPWIWLREL